MASCPAHVGFIQLAIGASLSSQGGVGAGDGAGFVGAGDGAGVVGAGDGGEVGALGARLGGAVIKPCISAWLSAHRYMRTFLI